MFLTIFVLVIVFGISYMLVSLPWLWKSPAQPRCVYVGDDTVLFASDLHLDDPSEVPEALLEMLEQARPECLVIVGDLFHGPIISGPSSGALERMSAFVEKVDRAGSLKRVVATFSENHDPPLIGEATFEVGSMEILLTNRPLLIETSGMKILATHGDFFSTDGLATAAVEIVLSAFGVRGAVERFLRYKMVGDAGCWVLMGHTHVPLVDQELRVANCGSFHSHILRSASSTAVLAKGGRIGLIQPTSNR